MPAKLSVKRLTSNDYPGREWGQHKASSNCCSVYHWAVQSQETHGRLIIGRCDWVTNYFAIRTVDQQAQRKARPSTHPPGPAPCRTQQRLSSARLRRQPNHCWLPQNPHWRAGRAPQHAMNACTWQLQHVSSGHQTQVVGAGCA